MNTAAGGRRFAKEARRVQNRFYRNYADKERKSARA
jgi:hypothetical protein